MRLTQRTQKHAFLFLTLLVACGMGLQAGNIYVAPGATGDGSMASPFGTIAQAAAKVTAGDTVFIAGGTYSEMAIRPAASGNATRNIVFCPWPETGEVVLTKADNVLSDETIDLFNLANLSYIWIERVTFKDMVYVQSCVNLRRASNCVVTGCKVEGIGHEEVATTYEGISMIYMNNAQDCVVSNCLFQNLYGDAVNLIGQDTKRNLISGNTFVSLRGKKRSWETTGLYKYSSAITASDTSFGNNVFCFNHITGGQDGVWLDRDGSRNLIVRNFGNGGERLVFNESRCAGNWFQENVAINMLESGYRSALYAGTNWSFDSRYINNVAYNCKTGIHLHKSKHNEVRNNIVYGGTNYSLIMTDSACFYGGNFFRNNLWRMMSKSACIQYQGKSVTPAAFAQKEQETGGIYDKIPGFVSTIAKPSSYLLKEGSACIGSGDGGIDMGAYPLYAFSDMGCDQTRTTTSVQPGVAELVTETTRGEQHPIIVSLAKPLQETAVVRIVPVAGDAIAGVDYELADSLVTFLPGETRKEVLIRFMGEETEFSKLLLLRLCNEVNIPYDGRSYAAFKLITLSEREALLNTDIYLEAESGAVGALWQTVADSKASGGKYVTVRSGNNSSNSAPADNSGLVSISFTVSRPTTYMLWLRTICPNANDDSFWLRLDNEEWVMWNNIPGSSTWQWNLAPRTYTMLEGEHVLHIGYREDGAKLDKLLFTCLGTTPEGMGGEATAIQAAVDDGVLDMADVSYYDLSGRKLSGRPEQGVVIARTRMRDGSIRTDKIAFQP